MAPATAANVLHPATPCTMLHALCTILHAIAGAWRIMVFVVGVLVCPTHGSAAADQKASEARRFPQAHITKAQWSTFFAETLSKPGAIVVDRVNITRIVVPQEAAVFFFTKPAHPAHPAAARRAIVTFGKRSYIHTSGYYAGNRDAFLLWMKAFTDQDRNLQRDIESPRGSVKPRVNPVKRLPGMTASW